MESRLLLEHFTDPIDVRDKGTDDPHPGDIADIFLY